MELVLQPISQLGRLVPAFDDIFNRLHGQHLSKTYADMTDATNVNFHKKRRRVSKASPTKLSTKLTESEADTTNPDTLGAAQGLASKAKDS